MKKTNCSTMAQVIRLGWGWLSTCAVVLAVVAGLFVVAPAVSAQTDLTVDVLVNSTNTTGYNTSSSSPGEYQRYPERYLEHLQIPYRVIDVSNTPPPDLSTVPLIIAGHRGLSLSSAWQQAIVSAVQAGTGFVNLDSDPAIGTYAHMQAIFGSASSTAGTAGTSITLPATYLSDGSKPHYILGLQMRWPQGNPASASGDLVYYFHQDDNGVLGTATSTVLLNAQGLPITGGTVLAKIGNDALVTAMTYGTGRAVDIGTYDFLRADRFGFLMGIDDVFWRSLVWAARKPFVLRGYPRFFSVQQDDPVDAWSTRVGDMFNPTLTGNAITQTLTDGSTITVGGPWRVEGEIQTATMDSSNMTERQAILDFLNAPDAHLRVFPHTVTGGSGGDLYWGGTNTSQLSDSAWLANYNAMVAFQKGNGPTGSLNGGNDYMPFSKHMIPHFWDLSNNTGADLWNSGVRYLTEIQQPGVYYSQVPAKTPAQRMPGLHPFRVYEQPPTNGNPNEIWSLFWADDFTVGSRAGYPAKTFFGFSTQLQGAGYPSFDAKWPQAANGISQAMALENWQAYAWRFWSSMGPVQIYNHDGGSMANATTQERQTHISTLTPWMQARGAQMIFMDDLGAYLHARVKSTLKSAQATSSSISLTFTGSATDMDGAPVKTYAYVFYGNDNGALISVPGFTNGSTVSVPNVAPPAFSLSSSSLSYVATPGGSNPPSQTIAVSNAGGGNLNWTVSESASWLTVTPTSGTNSGSVTAAVNISGLAQGTYTATIVFSAAGASNSPVNVPVTLTLAPPTLAVSPTSLSFSAFQGQGNPASQSLSITNSGAGTLSWTATSNASWLTLSPASGTAPSSVTVSVNTAGLVMGTNSATITITASGASGSPQTIPVTATLKGLLLSDNFSSGMDGLAVSPLGLASNWSVAPGALHYNGGGATQLYAGNAAWTDYNYQVTFQLSSLLDYPGGIRGRINVATGGCYAVWFYPNEKVVKLFRNTAWNIDTGLVLLGQAAVSLDTAPHTVNLSFAGSQIQVFYDGKQVISVSDATYSSGMVGLDVSNRPITFGSMLVTSTVSSPSTLTPSSSTLSFSGAYQGPNPTAQTLTLSATGGALAWTAASTAPWLTVTPTSGTTAATLQVAVNTQGMAGGTYSGQIRLVSLGSTVITQTVTVNLNITVPPPMLALSSASMTFNAVSGQAAPATQTLTISNIGTGGSIAWTASTDAAWLTVSQMSGTTPASTSVGVNTTGLALGTYTGHVTITSASASNSPLTLTVTLSNLGQVLNENFASNAQGWIISPMGHASGWSVTNNIYSYAGFGASQSCAGNANWGDYTFDAGIRFSSLSNYPGGIRARVNPSTGAGYALWFYPGSGVVKLFLVTQWNIDGGGTVLLAQAPLSYDTLNFHDARMKFQGGQITVSWDGTQILSVSDSSYASGMVCFDASNQPVSYNAAVVVANQAAVTLAASPTSLAFATSGTTNPPSQTVNVTAGGAVTTWAVASNAAWLTATASSTVTPGTVTVSTNVSGLATGTYNGTISVYAPGGTNSPLSIPVTLSIQSGSMAVTPNALTFFGATTLNPIGQNLNITNSGSGTLNWSGSTDASWLSLTSASGTAPSATTVNVNTVSLATGPYSGNVIVSSPQATNSPLSVPVTVQVGTLLFNDNFSSGAGNWTVSPLGSPSNWSVATNAYSYNGGGTSNSSAGSQAWLNYNYGVDFKLASLNDYPGGIRGRVNLTSGSGYGAWIYPAEKVIKLYRIGQWNIDSGFTLLATSPLIQIDATNWHNLKLDFRGSTISVYYDNVLVIQATDTTYAAGAVALDVSNQPIQFTNVVVIGF